MSALNKSKVIKKEGILLHKNADNLIILKYFHENLMKNSFTRKGPIFFTWENYKIYPSFGAGILLNGLSKESPVTYLLFI